MGVNDIKFSKKSKEAVERIVSEHNLKEISNDIRASISKEIFISRENINGNKIEQYSAPKDDNFTFYE